MHIKADEIKTSNITTCYQLNCPNCQKAVLKVTASEATVPDGGYWLNGGDTNGALYRALPKEKLYLSGVIPSYEERSNERLLTGFVSDFLFGTCRACWDDPYYVAHLGLSNASYSAAQSYLNLNAPLGSQQNFLLSHPGINDGAAWLLEKHYVDSIGPVHIHTFGPFQLGLDPQDHGRDLILPIFDALRAICMADA